MIPYHKIPTPLLKEILQLCIDISYYEEAAKVRDELKGREEAENITRNEPSLDLKSRQRDL